MSDVMIDIETLGTRPGCEIVAIAAVDFEPQGEYVGTPFYALLEYDINKAEPAVLDWWYRQPVDARAETLSGQPRMSLPAGMCAFSAWLMARSFEQIWSYGCSFDFPIIADALRRCSLAPPWNYQQIRDVRTLRALMSDQGEHHAPHRADQDVLEQVALVQTFFRGRVNRRNSWDRTNPLT